MSKNYGSCSLCGEYSKYSYDHIPPRSCGNNQDLYFYTYDQFVKNPKMKFKKIHSQNGVKNKNACDKCNSLLGAKYDPELAKLRSIAIDSFKGNKWDDNKIITEKVIKSVFGHFISSSPYDQKSLLDEEMKNYFWDKKNLILKKYSLYVFLYPHESTIFVFKNYAVGQILPDGVTLPKGSISSLYFYPFAFIFMKKQRLDRGVDLIEFIKSNKSNFELKKTDWVFNNKYLSPIWPCEPNDDGSGSSFVVFNESISKNSILKH